MQMRYGDNQYFRIEDLAGYSVRKATSLTSSAVFCERMPRLGKMYFAYYNFCRIHSSIRCTPAMEAGITKHIWSLSELLPAWRLAIAPGPLASFCETCSKIQYQPKLWIESAAESNFWGLLRINWLASIHRGWSYAKKEVNDTKQEWQLPQLRLAR
jgi:hypothetical protein